MEHIMKKFLSLILTVAMCISIIIPAAASEADEVAEMYEMEALSIDELISRDLEEPYSERSNYREAVEEDLQIIEDYFGLQNVYIHTDEESTEFVYEKQYSEKYTDFIKVSQDGEAVTFDITEGDCHNTLCMMPDGTIILDGNEVIITTDSVENEDHGIAPASIYTTTTSVIPFAGTQAYQYSILVNTYEKASVNVYNRIKSVVTTALAAIISETVKRLLPGIPLADIIAGGVFSVAAAEVKDIAERHAPDSVYLSCIIYRCKHPSSTVYEQYYRYFGQYFAKEDFQGTHTATAFYERMVMN
ncbi:MAG: hypothetical protein HFG01_07255 [Oscillibacter sp.]|nr:hypothetical protein [Oscillibacter sp.]